MKKLFLFLLLGLFLVSFASAALTDGLVSYYKLDETSGTIAVDSLGLNDGTLSGTASVNQTGKIDKAYSFTNGQVFATSGVQTATNITLSLWFKTSQAVEGGIGCFNEDTNKGMCIALCPPAQGGAGHICILQNGIAWFNATTSAYNDNSWHFATLRKTGTLYNLTIDNLTSITSTVSYTAGTKTEIGNAPTIPYSGLVDEVSIWNRTLNSTEITELYNSGAGLSYPFGITVTPTVTLESPLNGTTISDVGTNFTVSGNNISSVAGTWDNVTYNVYFNNTLFNSTTVNVSGETFNETLFIDSFNFSTYEWNASACYTNITDTYCIDSADTNTLTVSLFTIANETYVNDTISGTLENFSVTINLLPGYDLLDASFIYNGKDTSPAIYAQGNDRYLLVSSYPIPILTTDTNITFYWDLTFTGDEVLSTDNRTQLVRAVLLDNCSTYTYELFNITLRDERTKALLNGSIEFIYTLQNKPFFTTINTHNLSLTGVSNSKVCSGINLSSEDLAYSAEIRYTSTGYASEFYHIQKADISPTITNIDLYDLNSSHSTDFKITYQDDTFNFVEGAIIQLQRKYISEDAYEVVEAPITSSEGTAVLHIDLDSVKYKATVVKDGVLLDTFDNLVFVCESELTGECEQKLLGEIDPGNQQSYDTTRDFTYSIAESNGSVIVTYSIPSGTPVPINIVLVQTDSFGNETIVNKTVTSSAGSIEAEYSTTIGDSYLDLYIYKSGVLIAQQSYIIPEESGLDLLNNNFFIVFILLLSLIGMAVSSPEWIVVNSIITMVIAGSLFLLNGLNFVVGLGGLLWLIIAGAILIFKLAKQEDR